MKKTMITFFLCAAVLVGLTATFNTNLWAGPPDKIVVQMRVYEGFREGSGSSARAVSSYFLKPLGQENVVSDFVVANESKRLKRVFNLSDIKFVTADIFFMPIGGKQFPFQALILNGRKFLVQLNLLTGEKDKFSVEVFDGYKPKEKRKSLLKTKILLPVKKSTALGFEDSRGKIFFLSFNRPEDPTQFLLKNATNIKDIQKTRLIKKVDPEYPQEAKKRGIGGTVTLEAVTDVYGRVAEVKIIDGHPLLSKAAIEALKQWVYEPYILNGVPKPVKFSVVVKFNLDKAKKKESKPLAISFEERPELLKKIQPKYPPDALKAKIQGNVTVEVTTDINGNVVSAKVIEGHPLLRQAAVESVRNWKYRPFYVNNVKKTVRFTVVIKFRLQ